MKRLLLPLLFCVCLFSVCVGPSYGYSVSIGGVVRQPLNLTAEDFGNFVQSEVTLSEVTGKNNFDGTFSYKGVSLKVLLQAAAVQKEVDGYSKSIDLAIVVRNKQGKTAVLSWGEVFYRNPGEVIIATSSRPIMPGAMKSCGECHGPDVYQPGLDRLKRTVGFPKLVVAGDFYTDRCLEDVVNIAVVDIRKAEERKKEGQRASSSRFTVVDSSGTARVLDAIAGHPRVSITMKELGSGRGYHGVKHFEGVSLKELIGKTEGDGAVEKVALVTSTDGYRSLVSLGELFFSALGDRVIITDHAEGAASKKSDKFSLVVPDDIFADRMVKTVSRIEVISLKPVPRLYVIGVGCGDSSLITLEAISCMGKAGAFIGGKSFTDRFAKYMGDKPILFDPFSSWEPVYKKNHPGLSDEEVKRQSAELRGAEIKRIWDTLKAGKSVALLEPGDATIYGGWENWLPKELSEYVEVVAGMSSFSAANAMIGKNISSNTNSMILTTPWALQAHEGTIKSVAEAGDTMAIFMGLKDLKTLLPSLKRYYPDATPVTIAYKAGITHEKRLVRTTLGDLQAAVEKEKEDFLGLIYIGGK